MEGQLVFRWKELMEPAAGWGAAERQFMAEQGKE